MQRRFRTTEAFLCSSKSFSRLSAFGRRVVCGRRPLRARKPTDCQGHFRDSSPSQRTIAAKNPQQASCIVRAVASCGQLRSFGLVELLRGRSHVRIVSEPPDSATCNCILVQHLRCRDTARHVVVLVSAMMNGQPLVSAAPSGARLAMKRPQMDKVSGAHRRAGCSGSAQGLTAGVCSLGCRVRRRCAPCPTAATHERSLER